MSFRWRYILGLILILGGRPAVAGPAPFDLAGPTLEVTATHAGKTLPISQVPNLTAGDRLWIKADLPEGQSVHYLLVAVFLRGATNPPPENDFQRLETWTAKGAEGLRITVPPDAQQVLVFLAPRTGGDFKTLTNAVRGRPGAFVRASQDLNQAFLDRSRLDRFLAAVRAGEADPDRLLEISPLLARGLAIKIDADCLQKEPALRAVCLTQGEDSLILDDGHSTSIVQALTTGEPMDLAMQVSATPQAGYGYASPYIGAIADIARILDSLHTARYQYIPALATASGERLSLLLNTPPSFHDPLSVLVASLPAVEPAQAPPLRPVDAKAVYCAKAPDLVLPVEGAPLVFSTDYAHDMVLRIKRRDGEPVDLPVRADAEKGGLVVDRASLAAAALGPPGDGPPLEGSLHGYWGFEPFDGPEFRLVGPGAAPWRLAGDDAQALIAGRDDTVRLQGLEAPCVEAVVLRETSGETRPVEWKRTQSDELTVTLPLQQASAGPVTLQIKRFGDAGPDVVPLQALAQAGHLESFVLHAGDSTGDLTGGRLDEVEALSLRGVRFAPERLTTHGGVDELVLAAVDGGAAGRLAAGANGTAKVTLKDGRTLDLKVTVQPPRPSVALIGKSIVSDPPGAGRAITLAQSDQLASGDTLTFAVRAVSPAVFSGHETIEVATTDGAAAATLTFADGLILQDAKVALATLDTGKFGASTFGPLRFRIVDGGTAGDWQPLASLVRLPAVQGATCPPDAGANCQLVGNRLFLIAALSDNPHFDNPVTVPEGFTSPVLAVPHPRAGRLYVKLRDAPEVIDRLEVAVGPAGPPHPGD